MPKYKNIKTTCNKNSIQAVLPAPTAKAIAEIVNVSESYVKKILTTDNYANEAAENVKLCKELIIGGQEVLVKAVTEVMHKRINK